MARIFTFSVVAAVFVVSVATGQTAPVKTTATAATTATTTATTTAKPSTAPTVPTAAGQPAQAAPTPEAKDSDSVIAPQGFTYNPEGRRDPFVSLLRRGIDEKANNGQRASGLAGMGTSEVSLRGTMISHGGFVGILQGVDSKSYIVRVGDKLADGAIKAISADTMVIVQQVNDPLSLEKEREVRKLLRQTEEAK
jgi:Tfp pilus assembly protein PilP